MSAYSCFTVYSFYILYFTTLLHNIMNNAMVNMFGNQVILCDWKRGYAINLTSSGGPRGRPDKLGDPE